MTLEDYLKKDLAPDTVKRYMREITLFISSLETDEIVPQKATYNQLMHYLGQLRERYENIAPALHAIKKYYAHLVSTQVRNDNPALSIRLRDRRNRDIQLQDLFTPSEMEQFFHRTERYAILKNRNQIILGLLIYQGLTSGEMIRLSLEDIDLEKATIYIKSSRRSNARLLKLKAKQVFSLMHYIQNDRPKLIKAGTPQLLLSKQGTAETGEGITYLLETLKHLYPDRKLNAQTIRQSVITNHLKAGKDLRVVQVFAGHKYPSTTEKYKQTHVEELKHEVLKYHPLK